MAPLGELHLGSTARTLHVPPDTIPFAQYGDAGTPLGVRVLHARPSEGFIVTQMHAPPGAVSDLHRHLGPVFGWTTAGAWGHDRDHAYVPGSYIFETPGVP